jgi:hypothetical protein
MQHAEENHEYRAGHFQSCHISDVLFPPWLQGQSPGPSVSRTGPELQLCYVEPDLNG